MNAPQIKEWLHKVVGPEGEDLSRHDKWLCMMYPRLKLLKDLLKDDGVIFVSIDDNEVYNARMLMNDVFGERNFIDTIIWKKRYGGGSKEKYLISVHEYILFYAKNKSNLSPIFVPTDNTSIDRYYKYTDEKHATRGPYRTHPLEATKSMGERKNLVYPIPAPDGTMILPKRQWLWSRERTLEAIKNNEIIFLKGKDGKLTVHTKQYLKDESGVVRNSKAFSIIDNVFTQHGTNEILSLFGDAHAFAFPKPTALIKRLIQLGTSGNSDDIILDSFAGSGTTGQAVLELNKEDGGNRKYVLVELEKEIARRVTAKRLQKVIAGYKGALFPKGTGQGFKYLDLNGQLFDSNGMIGKDATYDDLAAYIYFTETGSYLDLATIAAPFIGSFASRRYYLFFRPKKESVLDEKTVAHLAELDGTKVIYADKSLLDEAFCARHNIVFKQIPYELRQF